MRNRKFAMLFLSLAAVAAQAEVVQVGSGSYTTEHPGYDEANRNKVPKGQPQVSGRAAEKPIPTNDWWSNVLYENQSSNIFAYPIAMRTKAEGLALAYIPKGPMIDFDPVKISVGDISSDKTTVSDHSDWTFTMRWGDDSEHFEATAGLAMPFVYFTKKSSQDVSISIYEAFGTATVKDEMLIIEKGFNGASFVVYAPEGSTWKGSGKQFTSSLNGKDYWSAAILPIGTEDAAAAAEQLKPYAYVFPADTRVQWSYDEKTSVVRTDYTVTPDVKEGTNDKVLMGLLPHHWAHLASDSPVPDGLKYTTIRGEVRTLAGNKFTTENVFQGILPTLPYIEEGQNNFSKDQLNELIASVTNDHGLVDWTDSYNDGQLLNRLVQTARIAKESGNEAEFKKAFDLVKDRVENWLTYDEGEVAFLFYYNKDWTALIGYPAGHGQDEYLNDHHFHWGYFIHAAAFIEQYEPGWADKWGEMVNMLVRDAACTDHDDPMFPFIRNFSPFAGHCWANGMAALPQGNDQESSSEAMQFHSSLIHWGAVTGNKEIRDLGIYMYAVEQSAIEEYWFDMNERILPENHPYCFVSRVFGNDYDNATFWTQEIAASYGIELYPIHGGSLYLARNLDYARKFWGEMTEDTGILQNEANPDLWHDIYWQYLSFFDPQKAIELYDSNPNRGLKFGVSPALTYHWIHSMACLGQLDATTTGDYPISAAFEQNGEVTYVAHNYGKSPITVTFSDGYKLEVPAGTMATGKGVSTLPMVEITSPDDEQIVTIGNSVTLEAEASVLKGEISRVEFYNGLQLIAKCETAPYRYEWTPEEVGVYDITAKAVSSEGREKVSAPVKVLVANETSGETYDCSVTSKETTEGSPLEQGYTMTFSTEGGNNVVITCECLDSKVGLVAFLWDRTEGFKEYQMESVPGNGNAFTYTLKGLLIGTKIKFAVKFAFAGGLSVTKDFEYEVGAPCSTSGIETELAPEQVKLYPNPMESALQVELPAESSHVYVWDSEGRLMFEDAAMPATATINVADWQEGIYFIRIESEKGNFVTKLVKE